MVVPNSRRLAWTMLNSGELRPLGRTYLRTYWPRLSRSSTRQREPRRPPASTVAAGIRADGYHVSETSHVDCREATKRYLCVAQHKTTRETWTVRAADREQAAIELAKAMGWDLEDG